MLGMTSHAGSLGAVRIEPTDAGVRPGHRINHNRSCFAMQRFTVFIPLDRNYSAMTLPATIDGIGLGSRHRADHLSDDIIQ